MNNQTNTVIPIAFRQRGSHFLDRFLATAAAGVILMTGASAEAATILSKSANTTIYLGLPFAQLEFENPLAGTEVVLSHAVLDWRDADYSPGPPQWYDDWTVSGPGVDGNLNEIYLRTAGDWGSTTTMVPSDIVSIHLNGDQNDGIAQVTVDGVEVARLDMGTPAGSQTALVLVRGLSVSRHTIQVNDLGFGAGGGDDLHIMGAAALKESAIKWDQPPVAAEPTNVYWGWNQISVTNEPLASLYGIAADDWVCNSANPVTRIRWWGSFAGWVTNAPPGYMPNSFQITIWTDVPNPGGTNTFSHPGIAIWQTHCVNYTTRFVGWDYDPRSGNFEACFEFEQTLTPSEYFTQPGLPGTIYWISIAAEYWMGTAGPNPWGWKTRLRDPSSPAPDDAVRILQPPAAVITPGITYVNGAPIYWPDPTNSWDMAFELFSQQKFQTTKWLQVPDLSPDGMDVNATDNPQMPPPYLLADDFLCTTPGFLTDITIWASWYHDQAWMGGTLITLSIHDDIPAGTNNPYSMPGAVRWAITNGPGQYAYSNYNVSPEWWFTPPTYGEFPGDFTCYQYDFIIPTNQAFWQEGTPENPKVYWLDVQAHLVGGPEPGMMFGWKTCPTNWNDDACWINATELYNGPWQSLVYPPMHPRADQTVDLAFRLGMTEYIDEVKWSQPPILGTPPRTYNGWNEYSWYGEMQIVADDWVCTTTNPVTDIHWWGSFLNWSDPVPPQLPDAFRFNFWTDVPAQQGEFSHPGVCIYMVDCTNYSVAFAGWDIDPRDPNLAPEACFEFHQDLMPNEWFYQDPMAGTNIYWISIAAIYHNPSPETPLWGWKTRPRDPDSPAPDDAVRIFNPTAPLPGMPYIAGDAIWWPTETNSWDTAFRLTTWQSEAQDFGDAPASYPTLLANNAARHFIVPGFCLGVLIDGETNGLPSATANGDDINNLPDEDGVAFVTPTMVNTQSLVNVVLTSPSGSGMLDAWIDFDRNGLWNAGEQILNSQLITSGMNVLSFPVPSTAALGPTYARFRLSSSGGLLPAGAAADGEVQDCMVTVVQPHPSTNIVITNIVVAAGNVTVYWNAETNIHYLLQSATNLAPVISWSTIGSEVIGPVNWQSEPANLSKERFYRVIAPYVYP